MNKLESKIERWYSNGCFFLFLSLFPLKIATGLVRMRYIESDENLCLRGAALLEAIQDDIKLGLIPFWVSCFLFFM